MIEDRVHSGHIGNTLRRAGFLPQVDSICLVFKKSPIVIHETNNPDAIGCLGDAQDVFDVD
jgi:hypothetical protein